MTYPRMKPANFARARMKPTTAAIVVASFALATDMLVYGLAVPVLPTLAARHGSSPAVVGTLFAAYAGAVIVTTPLVGMWVDRVGPRRPLLAGMIGLFGATLLFAFAPGLALLFLARALQGASASVSWTAGLALLAAAYPPETRGRAMGTTLASLSIGVLIGPPLGGFLFDRWGQRAPFLAGAAMAALDAIARVLLVRDSPVVPQPATLRNLLRTPKAAKALVLTTAGAMLLAFLEPVLPLHMAARHGATPTLVGLWFGIASLTGAVTYPIAGHAADRRGPFAVARAGAALSAAALGAIGFVPALWIAGLCLSLATIASGFILAPTTAFVGELAETQRPPAYGAAYALFNLAYAAGLTVGPLLAGVGTSTIGFAYSASIFGAAVFVVTVVATRRRRSGAGKVERAER